jgi:hypothetical protein
MTKEETLLVFTLVVVPPRVPVAPAHPRPIAATIINLMSTIKRGHPIT